jgi:hypothetical protein
MIRLCFRSLLSVSMQCRVVVVVVVAVVDFGNCVRSAELIELLSFLIHLFEDLLIEQFGLAPALPEPGPGMSPE